LSKSVTEKISITNKLGLHARPAMMFVETAARYGAKITVCRCDGSETVDGKSIMMMMMLAATQGTEIQITAIGDDAPEAVADLLKLVQSNFSEE
jgi:phosphocarrier protein